MTTETFQEDDTYRGRLDLSLWRRILAHARPYRRELVLLGAAGAVVAGIDVLFPLVTGRLIDEAIARGLTSAVYAYGAAYGVLIVAMAACVGLFIVQAGRTATGIAYDLRTKGFDRLQALSFSFYDVRPVGWLVSRLTADCTKLSSLIPWFMLDLVWGALVIGGIVAAMLWLNWVLALVVLAIVPPLAVASVFFQRRLLESSRHVRRTNARLTASFGEALMGVRTTKALVREEKSLDEFQVVSSDMFRHSMRNALQSAVYLPLVITLGSLGVGLALWRGGLIVTAGDLSLGGLVAFMQYATLLSMPIQELARRFTDLQAAQAAAERVQGLLDETPEIRDGPEVVARIAEVARTGGPAAGMAADGYPDRIGRLVFEDVTFSYGPRHMEDASRSARPAEDASSSARPGTAPAEPVLKNFDLEVRPGQTVALVGATGGGKSTIVSLVARFYEPQSGRILIDGVDYRDRSLAWLQSKLGIVLQTPFLFAGSVRENIRYGRLDATDAEVEAAARLVHAHGFIERLEEGYETEVGEGGSRLSTGQRQLVSLARAVLADPVIFIMDEATSSVDTETEGLIQRGIDAVLEGRIAFVIAHRLSTIRRADVILLIDGGRIVERGTHSELLGRGGRYQALYTRQFAIEESGRVLAGS